VQNIKIIGNVRLLPRELAAKKLGINEKTFYRWQRDGTAPPVTKIGRNTYCEESSLEKWIRSREGAAA
jgi:predicted DNA-binding transcriptional regulator AlpA